MLPFLCLVKIFVLVFIPIAIVAITFFTVSGIGGGKSKSASVKLVDNQRICLTFFSDQVRINCVSGDVVHSNDDDIIA